MSAPHYHIYGNDSRGGPVDYTAVLATVTGTSWDSPTLPEEAVATFAVRAFDPDTGLEEENVDARLTITLDDLGNDLTGLPNAPIGLAARASAGGTAVVTWHYNPGGQGSAPTVFRVYLGTPTPDYSTPAATVSYASAGGRGYSATLSGLSGGTVYQVAVRAANASGEEPNTATVSVTGATVGPLAVESLTAVVVA